MEQGYHEIIFKHPKDLYINVKLNKWDYIERFLPHWHPRLEIYDMLMNVIRGKEEKEEYYELLMRGYLTAVIAKIAGRYSFQNEELPVSPLSGDGNLVSQIFLYITEHYQEEITPQVLAEHFGFSLPYFCRYFKQKTGETLTDYINSYRIDMSRHFLLDTKHSYSVEEIAGLVGYTNATYFHKKFKKTMGQTPLQYRKEWKRHSS